MASGDLLRENLEERQRLGQKKDRVCKEEVKKKGSDSKISGSGWTQGWSKDEQDLVEAKSGGQGKRRTAQNPERGTLLERRKSIGPCNTPGSRR